jgi:hypothetical protein
MDGCQLGIKCPMLHAKQDQVCPIGFGDGCPGQGTAYPTASTGASHQLWSPYCSLKRGLMSPKELSTEINRIQVSYSTYRTGHSCPIRHAEQAPPPAAGRRDGHCSLKSISNGCPIQHAEQALPPAGETGTAHRNQ